MRVVQINATCGIGSTGKICVGISQIMTDQNIENYILCSKSNGHPLGIPCANSGYIKVQALKSKILGNYGFNSKRATRKMIAELDRIRPDIVHLHNIHGHDCNLELLFSYFRREKTKLIWTFHDCWAFTAYCPHYTMLKCGKWKIHCSNCVQRSEHSLLFDRSHELFEKKKKIFEGLNLTIVTPSEWLANQVRQSFLSEYPVKVIYNGIDITIFKPEHSDIREKYGIANSKHIVLGVSLVWNMRKGLDVFVNLAKKLPENYQIVLIGTDEKTDRNLPENIISIHRTHNQRELIEIYSAADVFVNPTREEVLGLVNVEALACGTSGVTFNSGGSPECYDATCGSVVACDDLVSLEREIIRICTQSPYSKEQCVNKAREFDQNERFKEYVELYERLAAGKIEND